MAEPLVPPTGDDSESTWALTPEARHALQQQLSSPRGDSCTRLGALVDLPAPRGLQVLPLKKRKKKRTARRRTQASVVRPPVDDEAATVLGYAEPVRPQGLPPGELKPKAPDARAEAMAQALPPALLEPPAFAEEPKPVTRSQRPKAALPAATPKKSHASAPRRSTLPELSLSDLIAEDVSSPRLSMPVQALVCAETSASVPRSASVHPVYSASSPHVRTPERHDPASDPLYPAMQTAWIARTTTRKTAVSCSSCAPSLCRT